MPGMIVAPQPVAVETGAKVLAQGGNAFDAALACAAVQFIVDPHSCGVGGYLVMTYHRAGQTQPAQIIDAPAVAGAKVSPDMWADRVLRPNPDGWGYFLKDRVNDDGYQSICTPGMVRGMAEIHKRFCTRPWKELLAPAIEQAENGWIVGGRQAERWKDQPDYPEESTLYTKLLATPEAKRIYLKADGATREAGERIVNADYGRTLRRLAEAGPDDFYIGEMAGKMLADLAAHDAFVTAQDLAEYRLREEDPVVVRYRDWTVVTNQPPHGGPTLGAILKILAGYDLAGLGHNSPAYILRVSLAMKAAFADRNRRLGDPQFVDVPLEWMISDARAAEWRKIIDSGQPIDVGRAQPGSPNTTQVSVVDRLGNCVSLTHSLGSSSGVITPGLGFMYNNSMVNFHPYAGHPNSILPRKGRTTGMASTIVYRGDQPVLVLGAPGATRIITSVLQVILNVLDFQMPVSDAVLAPRFDCQGDTIRCHARIPEYVCEEVRKSHRIVRIPFSHGGFALVHAITIDPASGHLAGAADTGADGMALLVPDA